MNNKFIAIIPARYGSTRFPGKPLVKIDEKPMIQHVFERSKSFFDFTYVATDDLRIVKAVEQFEGNYIMTSDRHQSGTDRVAEALSNIEKQTNSKFDVVVNIQGDEPFIDPQQLKLVSSCFKDKKTQIATLIKAIEKQTELFDINKPKVIINKDREALYFSRTPIPYYRDLEESEWIKKHQYFKHIGLYAYRSSILREITKIPQSNLELAESLEQLRWIENGYKIAVRETNIENISIDTPADLKQIHLL